MIYKARVIDTSMFRYSGKIRIRILENLHNEKDKKDLSVYPETISDFCHGVIKNGQQEIIHNDQEAYISTPFGGGFDYGVFYLPQVNSIGLVSTLGDSKYENNLGEYVWMGGIFDYTPAQKDQKDEYGDLKESTINIPNESTGNYNGVYGDNFVSSSEKSFIMKTKRTFLADPLDPKKSAETMNWEKRPMENLVVINDSKVQIYHNILDYSEQSVGHGELVIDKGITLSLTKDNVFTGITIDEEGLISISRKEAKSENDEKSISIRSTTATTLETKIEDTKSKNTTNIIQDSESITLQANKSLININDKVIKLDAGDSKVDIFAKEISMNGGTHPVAVVVGDVSAESGLQASPNVTA